MAGYSLHDEVDHGDPTVQILGAIGETLLATPAQWRIRRLCPGSGELFVPDRANLKLCLNELTNESMPVALLAISGRVVGPPTDPALVARIRYRDTSEDATLPLSWIADRLAACSAGGLVVVLSARGAASDATSWLERLATRKAGHVIAVESNDHGLRGMTTLLDALRGGALDPTTGTITLRSIGGYLARSASAIAVQRSNASDTFVHPPPLGKLRDAAASHTLQDSRREHASPAVAGFPDDLIGLILPGRFRIEYVLARGAFGVVYRARQLLVERDVAIKVLLAGVDPTSKSGRLFVQEIQSVGRLSHPHVVRIYHADIAPDGRLFYAMELLTGRDLEETITREGPLVPKRAVELSRQLLAGLGAAHEAGLVHADVKPANTFIVNERDHERLVLLDFGMARLRKKGDAADSAGGTPAYMAPEQLNEGRVDARSDLFAAALVLVTMLTGWRRTRAAETVPPLTDVADASIRQALARALAIDPADRYQTAEEFAEALAGRPTVASSTRPNRPPFRYLASLTEDDGDRLHGRDREIAVLAEHALYRRAVIYTAPSGVGKTSLLRAGLVPRLKALDVCPIYFTCRAGAADTLAQTIWPGASTIAEAIRVFHRERRRKLVLILDQLEPILGGDLASEGATDAETPSHIVLEALSFHLWPPMAEVSVVLSVREDFLARLLTVCQRLEPGIPIERLGPLGLDAAREAILAPLAEARLAMEPALVDVLLVDLQAAAAAIGPEMGWGTTPAVYPPHLQLACSSLYEALGPGDAELSLAHYQRLGGLDAIVGEYLDRVLETELDARSATVARDLFLALVTSAHTRAMRTETELADLVGGQHGVDLVSAVLNALLARGLLVRVRTSDGDTGWELIHDSLVPRVLGWIDRRDLARRRAVELVRHHLRRSRPDLPSLLDRDELREVRGHWDAVQDLEAEWVTRRAGPDAWTPGRLVSRSISRVRRQTTALISAAILLVAIASLSVSRYVREKGLQARNIGRFQLDIAFFEWQGDLGNVRASQAPAPPDPRLRLVEADEHDPDSPGKAMRPDLYRIEFEQAPPGAAALTSHIEARGGRAFLLVDGRGSHGEACAPSVIPLRELPGYYQREAEPRISVVVPTCSASHDGMAIVPGGLFIKGGLGDPPATPVGPDDVVPEEVIGLPTFSMDRVEVTNAMFRVFAEMRGLTDIRMPSYPKAIPGSGADNLPVSGINWVQARAYCRFLGKSLPTSDEWQKSVRGGLMINGLPNPFPRRNVPWGEWRTSPPANLGGTATSAAQVATFPDDKSPYDVMDLAGNIQEWTDSVATEGTRVTRGGNWDDTTTDKLLYFMAFENERAVSRQAFSLGFRCASHGE